MHPKDGRVVSNFIMQALSGEPITIFGEGKQTRAFCYVGDLIEAFIRIMATADEFTGPVNSGNLGEFTMIELAQKIITLTGSTSEIVFHALPSDDPKQRKPDITVARSALGWEPTVALEQGQVKTIDYFRRFASSKSDLSGMAHTYASDGQFFDDDDTH